MKLATLFLLAFASPVFMETTEKSVAAEVDCYVCLGRDYESCEMGKTRCGGSCYKVVDTAHDLIAKGCTFQSTSPVDKSNWFPKPEIKLYWTMTNNGSRDHIRGTVYFCRENMCNRGSSSSSSYFFLTPLFIFIALLWRIDGRKIFLNVS